ncbi:MAG: histidine phosphatase family protein [Clostridia bacterium]|nr:histidine phosphatase family protein [Clostridia bacterium]
MRILIIRHGDPDYANDTLTEKGHREAALLAQKLSKEKIDYLYSSPLGRAKHTCDYTARALHKEKDIVIKDWLAEFGHPPVQLPLGQSTHAWDWLPKNWVDNEDMYHHKNWYKQDFYKEAEMERRVRYVTDGLDELLGKHGYVRDGEIYKTEQGNHDTIALFCHFGLEMLLLSHLLGFSAIPLWHHFTALTSSVTTIYTEERQKGTVIFRCAGFGDTGHLYAGGEEPSFAARFCEVYEDDTRH